MVFRALNLDELAQQFSQAKPFPFVQIDNLLDDHFLDDHFLGDDFRGDDLRGQEFARKMKKGAPVMRRLTETLHSPEFVQMLSNITGIDNLLVDERMLGGGLQQNAVGDHLDMHLDFNYLPDVKLFRRLSLQLYLNQGWEESWGGKLELWDRDSKVCHHSLAPILGRCVIFEISDHSFHGTTRVSCPPRLTHNSIVLYYYTREAPAYFANGLHGTTPGTRPREFLKGKVLMPIQAMARRVSNQTLQLVQGFKGMFRRPAPADPVATEGAANEAVNEAVNRTTNGTAMGATNGVANRAASGATRAVPEKPAAEPPVEVHAGPH